MASLVLLMLFFFQKKDCWNLCNCQLVYIDDLKEFSYDLRDPIENMLLDDYI